MEKSRVPETEKQRMLESMAKPMRISFLYERNYPLRSFSYKSQPSTVPERPGTFAGACSSKKTTFLAKQICLAL
jgi:hypothetical protein